MTAHVQIRRAHPRDFDALGAVFHDAVGQAVMYTEAQRAAWSPSPRHGEAWDAQLAGQMVWLAESEGNIVGFMTLMPDGCIDLAYIRGEAQNRGVFSALFLEVFQMARLLKLPMLWTDASLHAIKPFGRFGFRITREDTVERGGEKFARCRMEMKLDA